MSGRCENEAYVLFHNLVHGIWTKMNLESCAISLHTRTQVRICKLKKIATFLHLQVEILFSIFFSGCEHLEQYSSNHSSIVLRILLSCALASDVEKSLCTCVAASPYHLLTTVCMRDAHSPWRRNAACNTDRGMYRGPIPLWYSRRQCQGMEYTPVNSSSGVNRR